MSELTLLGIFFLIWIKEKYEFALWPLSVIYLLSHYGYYYNFFE